MTPVRCFHEINHRPVGQVEFRQVIMTIGAAPPQRRIELRTLREIDGDTARALFCVQEPVQFRNVNYVATELRGRGDSLAIQLFLPFAQGTLRDLEPERVFEGLLGSEFRYDDFRIWFPDDCYRLGATEERGGMVKLHCQPVASPHVRTRPPLTLHVRADNAFIMGVDYHDPAGDAVKRELRIVEHAIIDSYMLPARMVMSRPEKPESSTTIELVRAWYDREIDRTIFESESRRTSYEYLMTL